MSARCSRGHVAARGSVAASDVGGAGHAESALSGSLGKLIALAEAYPELKANQNFLELQNQLAEIEDQIQMARRYYNGAVRNLNIRIQSFPDFWWRAARFPRGAVLRDGKRRRGGVPQIGFPGGRHDRFVRRACALALALLLAAAAPAGAAERILHSSATSLSQRNGDLVSPRRSGSRPRATSSAAASSAISRPPIRARTARASRSASPRVGHARWRGREFRDRGFRTASASVSAMPTACPARPAHLCDPLPHHAADRLLRRL